jgi:PAS domain S-box-containing protein
MVIAFGILLIVGIGLGTTISVFNLRDRALANSERELKNIALIIAEQTDRSFKAIELVHDSIAEYIRSVGISSSQDYQDQMSSLNVQLMLRNKLTGLPHLAAINLFNSDGNLVNFSRPWRDPAISIADRDHFKALKSDPASTILVSDPLRYRINGEWAVIVARRLTTPDGAFLGVAVGAVELSYFEKFFSSLALGDHSSIAIFRSDGALLVRHPVIEGTIGQAYTGIIDFLSDRNDGTVWLGGKMDQKKRLVAGHRVTNYPMIVTVGREEMAIRATWAQESYVLISLAGVVGLIIVLVLFGIVREMLRGSTRSQEMLREEKRKLHAALNNMSQGLCMFDSAGQLILYNERYGEIWGLPPEEIGLGTSLRELLDHHTAAGFITGDPERYCAEILAGVAQGTLTTRLVATTDGRIIQVVNRPMKNGGWVATHADVTMKTRAEAAVRESESRFSDLFEFSPDGLVLCDKAGIIRLSNGSANRMFGYEAKELVGQPIEKLLPQGARATYASLIDKFSQAPTQRQMGAASTRLEGCRRDGSLFAAEINLSRIQAGPDELFCAAVRDITDRQRIEEERDRNKQFLHMIIENIPVTVVVKDVPELRYLMVNRAGEEYYGMPRSKMIGKTASEFLSKSTADAVVALDINLLQSGRSVVSVEQEFENPVHGKRIAKSTRLVIPDASGKPRYLLIVLEDMTERKAVEHQLQQAQKMEAVGNLTGGLAHDFNNLLMVIIGNADLLAFDVADNPAASEKVETILQASLRGSNLTSQMLAFSRRQPLKPSRIDANETISDVTALLNRTLGEEISVVVLLCDDLWATFVDPIQLESALVNLAINARDAMPNGGVLTFATSNMQVRPEHAAKHPGLTCGDYVTIKVIDTGIGMSPAVLARVFEPFFTTKAPGKGTGLGLSMVYGYIKQSGGYVSASSEVGKGTTFKFYLPRCAAKEVERNVAIALSEGGRLGRNEVILAVDDNSDVRTTVVAQLRGFGYHVLEAHNAHTALDKLDTTETIDLLLTDIVMPGGINGKELATMAQAGRPNLKVLFTSGFPSMPSTECTEIGSNEAWLRKPYRMNDLANAVREVLDAR